MTNLINDLKAADKKNYYALAITKNGKYFCSHNGISKKSKLQWYCADFLLYFVDELIENLTIFNNGTKDVFSIELRTK